MSMRAIPLWAVLALCTCSCLAGLLCAGHPAKAASHGWKVYVRTVRANPDNPDDPVNWDWSETDKDTRGGEPFGIFPADHGSTYIFYKVQQ